MSVEQTQPKEPNAGVLIIGAEILSGKIRDENGPYLIQALRTRGVTLGELRIIEDDMDTIAGAVNQFRPHFDYVLTTGGIGPTHDDLTIDAVARAFGQHVIEHPELLAKMESYYGELTPGRRRLARVPQGAEVKLHGPMAVPVIRVDNVFIFAGVPGLMRASFEAVGEQIAGAAFFTRNIYLQADESALAQTLADVQDQHQAVAIGSYPRFDKNAPYRLRLTVDGRDESAVQDAYAALLAMLPKDLITQGE